MKSLKGTTSSSLLQRNSLWSGEKERGPTVPRSREAGRQTVTRIVKLEGEGLISMLEKKYRRRGKKKLTDKERRGDYAEGTLGGKRSRSSRGKISCHHEGRGSMENLGRGGALVRGGRGHNRHRGKDAHL